MTSASVGLPRSRNLMSDLCWQEELLRAGSAFIVQWLQGEDGVRLQDTCLTVQGCTGCLRPHWAAGQWKADAEHPHHLSWQLDGQAQSCCRRHLLLHTDTKAKESRLWSSPCRAGNKGDGLFRAGTSLWSEMSSVWQEALRKAGREAVWPLHARLLQKWRSTGGGSATPGEKQQSCAAKEGAASRRWKHAAELNFAAAFSNVPWDASNPKMPSRDQTLSVWKGAGKVTKGALGRNRP